MAIVSVSLILKYMKRAFGLLVLVLLGAGCADTQTPSVPTESEPNSVEASAVLPVDEYLERRTFKAFGEYISDRFVGYHLADDIEFVDVVDEVPVRAIMDGTVVRIEDVSGYGGMALIDHDGVNAIYGHIDLASSELRPGDAVTKGQTIANLGNHESNETDGERKHLHFGLYEDEPRYINGYGASESSLDEWVNPQNFFTEHGIAMTTAERTFGEDDLGGDIFHLEFTIPSGMEAEYIPSLQALNIFTLDGEGSARDRSVMLIRYFDAAEFLTLSTVDVLSTTDTTVGRGDYQAKRYAIKKKDGVADFVDQPDWRNERHMVTDFTAAEGHGRYYVVAEKPRVDTEMYQQVLASMRIRE